MPMARYYTIVFLVRRLVYIFFLLQYKKQPAILACIILVINIFYIIYLNEAKPHNTPSGHLMEMINETLLQLVSYHLLISMFRIQLKVEIDGEFVESWATLAFDDILGWSLIGHIAVL